MFDPGPTKFYMCEAAAAQGPECHIPHTAEKVLCVSVNADMFLGPAWSDVMPFHAYEDQVALFLWSIQRAADIGTVSVFLETVRRTNGEVVSYRAWIVLDPITLLEYERVATDSFETDVQEPAKKKARMVAPAEVPRASSGSIVSLSQLGDIFLRKYPDMSLGPSGVLSTDAASTGVSLFDMLSPDRVFDDCSDIEPDQMDVGSYITDDVFVCPPGILARGDMRSLRFSGQGIDSADSLRNWARPDIRPPLKLLQRHMMGILRSSGKFSADVSRHSLYDLCPTEFVEEDRPEYDGPVFKTAFQFCNPIAVPLAPDLDQNASVMKGVYPLQVAIKDSNRKRFAKAAKLGTMAALMDACSKVCTDTQFVHEQTRPTPGVPPRYQACYAESALLEERILNPKTAEDRTLANMWKSGCEEGCTTLSGLMAIMAEGAERCLGLNPDQVDVWMLSHFLLFGCGRNMLGWIPLVVLSGIPGGGKSETFSNVADTLPNTFVRAVDNSSRCANLVPSVEDDQTMRIQDEIGSMLMGNNGPQDKALLGEMNSMFQRGYLIRSMAGLSEHTKRLFRTKSVIMQREYTFGCFNGATSAERSALMDRALLIFFGTRTSGKKNGPTMVARKSTNLALSKRPAFESFMKYLHSLVVRYWSIEACGGIEINTENGSILQYIYAELGVPPISPRKYNYVQRIAIQMMVVSVITKWYRMGYGKKYNYSLPAFVCFCRFNSTVSVHHFVQADIMVREATTMQEEERMVMIGLKMCARVDGADALVRDGPYVVLSSRLSNVAKSIAPHTTTLGDGIRNEVLTVLGKRVSCGVPVLDEHDGEKGPRLKLLVSEAQKVLIPPQEIILTELARLHKIPCDTQGAKWSYRFEENGGPHDKYIVFKASIEDAIREPTVRLGAYSPKCIIEIPEQQRLLALAFFKDAVDSSGERMWYTSDSVAIWSNGMRRISGNTPLVVNVELLAMITANTKVYDLDLGLKYGGRLAPGEKMYAGCGIPMRRAPVRATEAVEIPNPYYMPPKAATIERSLSTAEELSGDMGAWAVDPEDESDEEDAVLDAPVFSCSYFPANVARVSVRPGEFECEVAKAHSSRVNGRDIPREWAGFEGL